MTPTVSKMVFSRKEWDANFYKRNRSEIRAKAKLWRQQNVERVILQDSRREDKKRNRENDLDLEHIKSLIKLPCSYCGDDQLRKTLDRVDNNVGHTKVNVVIACERCNYVRKDMPYEAWLLIVPGIRKARESGLFGSWVGGVHRRK